MAVESTAYARAGLIGNPSDGYFGKTISFSITDFAAKVTLFEAAEVEIVPSAHDRGVYKSVQDLVEDVRLNGYYGGDRLMKATVKRFVEYCQQHGLKIADRNFSLRYRSTIPRRLGMAGSSALVTATLRCLMEFYDIHIDKPFMPNLILSVENQELGISAGLQDRVIQVYEGTVYMDFAKELMDKQGHGEYINLDPRALPNLYIAYRTDLAEGSEVYHNDIKERWHRGDREIVEAMIEFASYASEVRKLIEGGKAKEVGKWVDKNFDLRARISRLDPKNVEMVECARSVGASAKFAGSGGTIVGTYEDDAMYARLAAAFAHTTAMVMRPTLLLTH